MNKLILVLAALAASPVTYVATSYAQAPIKIEYSTQSPTMTKLEATRSKFQSPKVKIFRCVEQELSDKATLRGVKAKK